ILFLKKLHNSHFSNIDTQRLLRTELSFRSTKQATLLRANIENRITELLELASQDSYRNNFLKDIPSLVNADTSQLPEQRQAEETLRDIREKPLGQALKHRILLKLEKSESARLLSPVQLLEQVLTKYRVEQTKREVAARLSGYKKNILAGKPPTPAQQATLDQLSDETREIFLSNVDKAKAELVAAAREKESALEETDSYDAHDSEELPRHTPAMADLLNAVKNPAEIARRAKSRCEALIKEKDPLSEASDTRELEQEPSFLAPYTQKSSERQPDQEATEPPSAASVTEMVVDLSIPYTKVQASLQKALERTDFRMLIMRAVQGRQYNEIGQSLNMSRRDVRRRIKELIDDISHQYTEDLKVFSGLLDQFLDDNEDDTFIEEAAAHLKLTGARLKFLTLISEPFFQQPCQIHKNRLFRKVQMLA
ncbi:MAG: hypothetical protein ACR2PT_22715, partial [Endozoicomonas sp.]